MQFEFQAPLFADMIRLHGKWYPDRPAMIDEEKTLTWGEIDKTSNQVGNGLNSLGIGRNNCVAIIMSNSAEFVEIMFGIFKAGAAIVPLNLAVNDEAMEVMLNDAGARAVFMTPAEHERIADRLGNIESLVAGGVFVHGGSGQEGTSNYAEWRDEQDATNPGNTINPTDICNIIYSSGTTGIPKGIKHNYGRRMRSSYELALANRYHFGAVAICPIGLYSNIAWAAVFCALVTGATVVIRNTFNPEDWVRSVEKYRVTHTMMVPLQVQYVLEAPNFSRDAVSSLEAIISGGSPLFEGLKKRAIEELGCAVIELYGLTEGFMTTLQPWEAEGRLASVGKPVAGCDYILVDDDDKPLGWGETGEICVRSIHWMTEYHNRPEATEEAAYVDPEGVLWLRTGDIGRIDEDGYLYIVDRKKDMILSGSQNIFPTDIEAVMVNHPLVSEVAVVGIPHDKWGETPLALVVTKGDVDDAAADDILQWTNERVGKRQRISGVEIRKEFPRNPNGKILKREIRREYWGNEESQVR